MAFIRSGSGKRLDPGIRMQPGCWKGYFRGCTLKEAMIYGTACAAIVLSGAVSCAEAMPNLAQVEQYLTTHSLSGS